MDEYVAVTVTSPQQLLQYDTIRLRSWKGDYLHRPDGPPAVTTWPTGELVWGLEPAASGRFRLRSWKGDYLHRPDGPPAVTTWPAGEIEWSVEIVGGKIRLRSWKGDYLYRPDPPGWLLTADTGELEWSVERKRSAPGVSDWQSWLGYLVKDKAIKAGGIYRVEDGMCLAASPGLEIAASEASVLAAALLDPTPLQAAGATINGQRYMYVTTSRDRQECLLLRRGPVSCLVTKSATATIVVLTAEGANPAAVTIHYDVASHLIKKGY